MLSQLSGTKLSGALNNSYYKSERKFVSTVCGCGIRFRVVISSLSLEYPNSEAAVLKISMFEADEF